MNIHNDREYWTGLSWPAAPNLDDYRVFEQYCKGKVLLLGSTKLLLPLCTEAWDITPLYADPKLKQQDWFSLDEHWDTVIIDGALALGEEYCTKLLATVLPNCDRFVARAFLNPNWPTKYACYFPRREELTPQPQEHPINEVYTFYIWNNLQS
jgi:hypothetical protein